MQTLQSPSTTVWLSQKVNVLSRVVMNPIHDADVEAPRSPEVLKNDESKRSYLGNYFYITTPWSMKYYLTVRGSENFHIYLWVAKDLAWTQNWYYPSAIFGSAALVWCGVLLYNSIKGRSVEEVYMLIALIMWLAANFLWMAGIICLVDANFSQKYSGEVFYDEDGNYQYRAAIMMESAISWIILYHLILRPFKIMPKDEHTAKRFESSGLKPRFSYFENWRQYEHMHTLCWLGKDLGWNRTNPYLWIVCLVPTITIAADFIWTTFKTKKMMIDSVHYVTQLMWVMANFSWALGNIFVNRHSDDPAYPLFHLSEAAGHSCRYAASCILFAAYMPIVVLYCIWLPLTFMGEIEPEKSDGLGSEYAAVETSAGGAETHIEMTTQQIRIT